MFWKKKQFNQKLLQCKVIRLEERVKQLECEHGFVFKKYIEKDLIDFIMAYPGRFGRVVYECFHCKKTKTRYWKYITKKEQQALKTLNLVPEDWEVKTGGKK